MATQVVRITAFQEGDASATARMAAGSPPRPRPELRRHGLRFHSGQGLQVVPRDVVELELELVGGQALQRVGQAVDRVLLHGHRAVAARVLDLQPVGRGVLLAHLDEVQQPLAAADLAPAALVEAELGVDELAPVLQQPVDAVVGAAALLVRGEGDDEVAAGRKPSCL